MQSSLKEVRLKAGGKKVKVQTKVISGVTLKRKGDSFKLVRKQPSPANDNKEKALIALNKKLTTTGDTLANQDKYKEFLEGPSRINESNRVSQNEAEDFNDRAILVQ